MVSSDFFWFASFSCTLSCMCGYMVLLYCTCANAVSKFSFIVFVNQSFQVYGHMQESVDIPSCRLKLFPTLRQFLNIRKILYSALWEIYEEYPEGFVYNIFVCITWIFFLYYSFLGRIGEVACRQVLKQLYVKYLYQYCFSITAK